MTDNDDYTEIETETNQRTADKLSSKDEYATPTDGSPVKDRQSNGAESAHTTTDSGSRVQTNQAKDPDDGDSGLPIDRRSFLKVVGGSAIASGSAASGPVRAQSSDWSLVVLPDTQKYASSSSLLSYAQDQVDWIVDNLSTENIAFVTHEGDLVNDGSSLTEWERIDGVMDTLDGDLGSNPDGLIPYATTPGDHDWAVEEDRSSGADNFRQYFGQSRYDGRSWFGGAGPDDLSHYQLFSAGGYDFLHIDLEWEAPGTASDTNTALGWAQSVMNQYPDRPTIVTTHSYVWDGDPPGRTTFVEEESGDGNSGESIWQEIIEPNDQVFMVLNGNFHVGSGSDDGEYHQVSSNAAGRSVYEILANYQDYPNGGNGWLRVIKFVPGGGSGGQDRIQVETYSPSLGQYATDNSSQFGFDLDFSDRFSSETATTTPAAPSDLIATATSASEIALDWTDNADNEDQFEIERSTGSESFSQVGTTGANVTSFTDTGLAAETSYTYRVRSVNEAGTSDYSNESTATTESESTTDTVTVEDWERSNPLGNYTAVNGTKNPYAVTTDVVKNESHSLVWDASAASEKTDYQLQASSGVSDSPQPGDTFRLYLYYDGQKANPRRFSKIFFATQSTSYDPQGYAIKVSAEDSEVSVVEYTSGGNQDFMPETSVSIPTGQFVELEYTWVDAGEHTLVVKDASGSQLASLSGTPSVDYTGGGVGLEHKWANNGSTGTRVYHDWFHIVSKDGGGDTDVAVSTDSPTDVGTTGATLNGTLTDLGGADSAEVSFEYRQTGASTWSTTATQTRSSIGSFSESIDGLVDGVEYEFRAVAAASDGDTDVGNLLSFTTSDDPPAVTTGGATDISETSATLNGTLDDLGGADSAEVSFEYRQTGVTDWTATTTQTLSSIGSFSEPVNDLSAGTEYEFRAVVDASDGDVATGSTTTFTTEGSIDTSVTVTTGDATSVGETSATLNGTLDDLGGADSAEVSFEYRQTGATDWTATATQTLSSTGSFSESVSDLSAGTEYEFRAVAVASDGDTDTGSTTAFTTTSADGTGLVEDWERSNPLGNYTAVNGTKTPYAVTTDVARNGSNSLVWDASAASEKTDYQLQASSGVSDTPQPGDTFRLYLYYDGQKASPRRFSKIFFATQSTSYDPQSYAIKVSAEDGEVSVVEYTSGGNQDFMPETSVSIPTGQFVELEYTWVDGGEHTLTLRDASGSQLASLSGTPSVDYTGGGVGLEHKWANNGSTGTRIYHDWFHIV